MTVSKAWFPTLTSASSGYDTCHDARREDACTFHWREWRSCEDKGAGKILGQRAVHRVCAGRHLDGRRACLHLHRGVREDKGGEHFKEPACQLRRVHEGAVVRSLPALWKRKRCWYHQQLLLLLLLLLLLSIGLWPPGLQARL